MSEWISSLPDDLRQEIKTLISQNSSNLDILNKLYAYLRKDEPEGKKRKLESDSKDAITTGDREIGPDEVIFEIPQVSFQSPVRKKLNLVFHLIEQNNQPTPVLSIANPATNVPLMSLTDLRSSIKLCLIIPILGNSTNPQKKSTVSLFFWINDTFAEDPVKNDPIICQINLDIIKKQMMKSGKLPANIDDQLNQSSETNNLNLNPVQERIIDYFQRQFRLCGINIINYLPCNSLFFNKYTLNTDSGLALSVDSSEEDNFILIDAHKGSKEGALMFLKSNQFNESYLIYGFKKPVLLYKASNIKSASYSNITRNTFSLIISVMDEKDEEKSVEFSMIDQSFFQVIDNFIKAQNINDNSFDDKLREKIKEPSTTAGAENGVLRAEGAEDDEDEEDDGDYQGAAGEESDVEEEYNSNAASDVDGEDKEDGEEDEDGVFNKAKEEEDIEV